MDEPEQAAPSDRLLHEEAAEGVPPGQPSAALLRFPRPHPKAQCLHVRLRVGPDRNQPTQEQQLDSHCALLARPKE